MKDSVLLTKSVKNILLRFKKIYKIDCNDLIDKIKKRMYLTDKKLIKMNHFWTTIWEDTKYKKLILSEILELPVYIPIKIEESWMLSIKKINNYLIPFHIDIDIDVKEIISNMIYIFIYHIYTNYSINEIPKIIEYYIIHLINIDNLTEKNYSILQELIIRALLIEMIEQKYIKVSYNDVNNLICNIKNKTLKKIILLALNTYKKMIIINL